jgi:hypothetical protein
MLTDFKYKDCNVTVFEADSDYMIALRNQFGARCFKTTDKQNGYLKVKEAYAIEQEIIENVFGNYYGMHPIAI